MKQLALCVKERQSEKHGSEHPSAILTLSAKPSLRRVARERQHGAKKATKRNTCLVDRNKANKVYREIGDSSPAFS